MAFSARPTSTDLLTKLINQTAHGFALGTVIVFNGTVYVAAEADIQAHCEGVMMVSIVPDVNSFYATQVGYCTGLPGVYVAGDQYYLSASVPGTLTTVAPSGVGQFIVPCFVPDSTTSGYFYTSSGMEVKAASIMPWSTVTTDTSMIVNNGYFTNSGPELNMTLPVTATPGDIIRIATVNTGGFAIKQNAGQTINFIQDDTTTGTGGVIHLVATEGTVSGSIDIICVIADTNFKIIGSTGNYTVA